MVSFPFIGLPVSTAAAIGIGFAAGYVGGYIFLIVIQKIINQVKKTKADQAKQKLKKSLDIELENMFEKTKPPLSLTISENPLQPILKIE